MLSNLGLKKGLLAVAAYTIFELDTYMYKELWGVTGSLCPLQKSNTFSNLLW